MGGKSSINPDAIEKFLMVRGILEPEGGDYANVLHGKKDVEAHAYVTRMAPCAGEAFELDAKALEQMNTKVEEMDALEVIELDPATFKYDAGLIEVFR